ncbi:MAG: 50S ribosomal protein L31 [Parcubacteria group bacterium GW2011_GWA2_38_13b]|nr:MAG: 50S ribosomal protein L31 [Parcubacteria group bacterium GW2011_GWA2_38_13b]
MKKKIHPKYFPKAKVQCACGNSFIAGSTKEKIETEICSACHPFYSGKDKLIDTAGIVDKFKKRMEKTKVLKKAATERKETKK